MNDTIAYAAYIGDLKTLKELCSKINCVNIKIFKNGTLLHAAAGCNTSNSSVIDYLLQIGLNPCIPDNKNRLPMDYAYNKNNKIKCIN